MKILRNDEVGTWTLVPIEEGEADVLTKAAAFLAIGDKLAYGGRSPDTDGGPFSMVNLFAGAREERKRETTENVTVTQPTRVGGVKILLRGSTEADKYEVNAIRNTCFMATSGLLFLGTTEIDGKPAIITTGKQCKHCQKCMIDFGSCEWNTCSACAAICEHVYETMPIHGPTLDIGVSQACTKCGRSAPKVEGTPQKTVLEQHLEVERLLGVTVIYANGPHATPSAAKAASESQDPTESTG